MRYWLLLAAAGGLILQGCIADDLIGGTCDEPDLHTLTGPWDGSRTSWVATGPLPILFWASPDRGAEPVTVELADGASAPGEVSMFSNTSRPGFGVLHAEDPPVPRVHVRAACPDGGTTTNTLIVVPTGGGDAVSPGHGVEVYTAGFWTNGTLFYTNMHRVQFDDAIPHPDGGELGQWPGGEALPVYVYDGSRDEMPARYEEAGYFTTIRGFNEALKGMVEGQSRVARLAPEDAYTRPDARDHALYGDELVFYIELVRIADVPCEVPEPVCEVPRPPGAALAAP